MDSTKVMELIEKGEGLNLEFKTSFNVACIETLVAFANTKGGRVLIGVSNSGKVVGVDVAEESVQHWVNEIKGKTEPSIIPDVEVIGVEGKNVVSLGVNEFPVKPVSQQGRFFKRIANSNHQLSVGEIADEHLKTMNSSWDYYIDTNHSMDNISTDKVNLFVDKIENQIGRKMGERPLDFLKKLEMIRQGNVTFGAYLLFAKDYCLLSEIQIGRFKSEITIIDSITLNSDLFTEVDETLAFIKKHLMVEYIITGNAQHEERFDYPLEAIREIVVNMIVHRDYRSPFTSIIKIYDNRIEFYNPGNLYGGLTIEKLLSNDYTSQTRNKLVAKAFKEVGLVERYGSGIRRITDICKNYGMPEPYFENMEMGFKVVLYKRVDNSNMDDVNPPVNPINPPVNPINPPVNPINPPVNPPVNTLDSKILQLIVENSSITYDELAKITNKNRDTIRKHIGYLQSKGYITRIGSAKTGYWRVN